MSKPADRDSCEIEMPAGCRLIQAAVEGRIATVSPAGNQGWRVPLVVKQLPQRIEVLFEGRHAPPAQGWNTKRIAAPTIREMPTDKTLWTIAAPAEAGGGEMHAGHAVGELSYELARLQSLSLLINLPADRASTSRAGEIKAWFGVWFEHSRRRATPCGGSFWKRPKRLTVWKWPPMSPSSSETVPPVPAAGHQRFVQPTRHRTPRRHPSGRALGPSIQRQPFAGARCFPGSSPGGRSSLFEPDGP